MEIIYGTRCLPKLIDFINDAKPGESLDLCTAYVTIGGDLHYWLREAAARGVKIQLLARRKVDAVELARRTSISAVYVKNLHAKIYIGPRIALCGSMNLTENQSGNALDQLVVLDRRSDAQAYAELASAFRHFCGLGKLVSGIARKQSASPAWVWPCC